MDATEKLAQMMIRCGLATGHGDTIDDLIFELEKQIKNTSHAFSDALKEIEQLRLANSDLQIHYDYARTEHYKLKAEVKRLRGSLAFISILQPFNDQSWESHARFMNAYAIYQLEEEE
jgi:peptidoglycan hydrolase CwlO-like protein